MKKIPFHIVVFLLLFAVKNGLLAQGSFVQASKSLIDTGLFDAEGRPDRWSKVGYPSLSPRGGYVAYGLSEHSDGRNSRLVVEDREGVWKEEYSEANHWNFSRDERELIFQQGDSVYWVGLGGNKGSGRVVAARPYSLRYPFQGDGEWIAYQEKGGKEEVVLENLLSGQEQRLGKASWYGFSPKGKMLWLERKSESDSSGREELWWVDLVGGGKRRIWTGEPGEGVDYIVFDATEEQGAFVPRRRKDGRTGNGLWYYRVGQEQAELRVREGDTGLLPGAAFTGGWMEFSATGRCLFFGLQPAAEPLPPAAPPGAVKVDVWSYRDRVVQPDQLFREGVLARESVMAVVEVEGKGARLLAGRGERLETPGRIITGEAAVVSEEDTTVMNGLGGAYRYGRSYHLVSLSDGERRWLGRDSAGFMDFQFSPDGRWLFYYDIDKEQYYSYGVQDGVVHCLTKGLAGRFSSGYVEGISYLPAAAPAGWWETEHRILLYDRYDLWGLDPSGRRPAINITGGYGAKYRLGLRLLEDGEGQEPLRVYKTGDSLVFTGFGEWSKENGFVRQVLGSKALPGVLTMGSYLYYQKASQEPSGNEFNYGMKPVKAALGNCWIVERQTASEAPNYFVTTDWIHYRQLSDVRPQAGYRWLRAELVNYRGLDGRPGQGILYKPEDFDANRKYPVILHYYEQVTHRLHEFALPGYTEGDLNIPWFVSRGYLVFTPDIYFERWRSSGRSAGQWAYNAVIGAAKYLSTLPYVDSHRMGLQGHSFGGWETNYLVTHSHLFAAACEFSGLTDVVSYYLTLSLGREKEEHIDYQAFVEEGQDRIGATLWQQPELYLDQSAVLRADRVTTPMLLVHNKKDAIIGWRQGMEWYMALRRLHKPVWMLQYDESNHGNQGKEAKDFTERLTQFFGYYLKGEAPPEWMTRGVPARLKGVETGLATDASGRTP